MFRIQEYIYIFIFVFVTYSELHVVYMSREFSIDHRIANRSSFLVAVLRGTIMSPQPGFTFCDLTMISTAKRVIIPPIAFKPNF